MNQFIGVVGNGIVGNAVFQGMKHAFNVVVYDKDLSKTEADCMPYNLRTLFKESPYEAIVSLCKVIFVCVPTPMNDDGSCNTSIVESVVEDIDNYAYDIDEEPIVVIKSTVPPGTTDELNAKYSNVSVVFNPEFLKESSAVEDFKNQDRIIIGGNHSATREVKQLFQKAYPNVPTTKTSATIAEMVKYVTNCFLATKVGFANEIYQICQKVGIDYDKVIEYATKDERLGSSHWAVPGPDGLLGFGKTCFPKDINALMSLAEKLGVVPMVMNAVWWKNLEVRPEKDWESMKGRAVN